MSTEETTIVNENDARLDLNSSEGNRDTALAMARQCDRSLAILSPLLDPAIYDQQEFVAAVKAMILGSRYARVRILLREAERVMRQGHRLLELAFKLSSFMEIRELSPEHQDFNEAWFIADGTAYIRRQLAHRYEATANFCGAAEARLLLEQFDALWELAQANSQLRRLHL